MFSWIFYGIQQKNAVQRAEYARTCLKRRPNVEKSLFFSMSKLIPVALE